MTVKEVRIVSDLSAEPAHETVREVCIDTPLGVGAAHETAGEARANTGLSANSAHRDVVDSSERLEAGCTGPCLADKQAAITTAAISAIANRHPCFAQGKPNGKGRIHLPVSPGCNIGCRFCERSINRHEQRPGVTAQHLKPAEAAELIADALALAPELSVVGIAGPGDTLASPYALRTFCLIKEQFPHLLRCLSTNGLLLKDRLPELLEAGIDTLTVTVNDIDHVRLAQIVEYVIYEGRRYTGTEATKLLVAKQLAGIKAAAAAGLLIKVNTVLIPSINGEHIGSIAQAVKQAGAGLYNIIPLLPSAKMAHLAAPTCRQIDAARQAAEEHISVFRHCRHCRADAIGIPGGKDIGEQLYLRRNLSGVRAATVQANTFSHG